MVKWYFWERKEEPDFSQKTQTGKTMTNTQGLVSFLSVIIEVSSKDGKMSEGQFHILQECLLRKVLEPGPKLRFSNARFHNGFIHLTYTCG